MKDLISKIPSDLIPYLILIGIIMAATGALQMWLVSAFLWQS
jgi:hypothetical protein